MYLQLLDSRHFAAAAYRSAEKGMTEQDRQAVLVARALCEGDPTDSSLAHAFRQYGRTEVCSLQDGTLLRSFCTFLSPAL